MKKKVLALALALALCLGLMNVPALAAQDGFQIENGTLIKYNGSGGSVIIPNSVTRIEEKAFQNCTSLTSVVIPNSVTEIGSMAFDNCESLTSVTIPDSVTKIEVGAFYNCTSLTSVVIPNSVTELEDGIFYHCTRLTNVILPNKVTRIGAYTFFQCESLTSVNIPDSVTIIGAYAFYQCDSLTSVSIPDSVTVIGISVFNYLNNLTDIYYSGTEEQWEAIEIASDNDWLTYVSIHYNASQPQQPAGTATADPTNDKLTVNGTPADPTVYKIDGSNYFKIRDVAALLNGTEKQFAVDYDNTLKSVTATTGQGYAKLDTDLVGAPAGGNKDASPSNDTIYVNGEKIDVQVYKIDGGNYFKLRDLGKALNFSVDWNKEQGMMIDTSKPYSE